MITHVGSMVVLWLVVATQIQSPLLDPDLGFNASVESLMFSLCAHEFQLGSQFSSFCPKSWIDRLAAAKL